MHSNRMRTAHSSNHLLGRGCLPQCMLGYPLGVGLEIPPARPLNFPPGCGPGDSPGQTPQLPPLGVGLGDLQGMLGYHPPGDLQGMLGYHLQCMLGYHPPPWTEWRTGAKMIPCSKLRLRAGKKFFLGEHQSFIWGHWCTSFGLLVMFPLC